MQNTRWTAAVENAPVPQRAAHYFKYLATGEASKEVELLSSDSCRILASLFSGSQVLSELIIAQPHLLADLADAESMTHPLRRETLKREISASINPPLDALDYSEALRQIRLLKQRRMLRIAARDLARLANAVVITRELSDLADVCLNAVAQVCFKQITERLGRPYHQMPDESWQPTDYCVLGLGKLGGQELNYSSDVDVVFVYEEEGAVFKQPPPKGTPASKGIANHQFFIRFAESFIAEVGRATAEGQLYRIDLRLRPEGKSGPLARSLTSYENFYAQWGQTWERMMLIKARCVAGEAGLAHEFAEMIQSFRYPRTLGERFREEIAAMKQRIEEEVVRDGEQERNVKLGRGGIREVEFIVQTQQLLHAGRNPFLQNRQTLPAMEGLVKYGHITQANATALSSAYLFLRDVEHRLQMENNLQTHTIPTGKEARQRLAALMGFSTIAAFEKELKTHMKKVRDLYVEYVGAQKETGSSVLPKRFEDTESAWLELLHRHCFREPQKAFKLLSHFIRGPGFAHISARTEELARELASKLLALCPHKDTQGRITNLKSSTLSDPDRVLARLDSFIAAYGSRTILYETWTRQPSLFELLILLFDRSEFLAETAIRTPDLVDDLVLSGHLRRRKTSDQILEDLRHGAGDPDQKVWMRRYHETEFMRIGLREIIGLADFEQNLAELSGLADACLQYAVEVILKKHRLKAPPFCIVGLGKLGGSEITYGSDLDVVFVTGQPTKNLPKLQKMAAEILDLLSTKTEHGSVFNTDARLRPDGEKGLLVNTLTAYEDYYRQRAMLWEIQSLTRARAIAGDREVGAKYMALTQKLSNFKQPNLPLTAYIPEWKKEIGRMRLRIEKERTPVGKAALAIKTGAGGLVDAEFTAQALCMEHGLHEADTLKALQSIRNLQVLSPADAEALIDNFRKLRRIEIILRRWSYEGETELPDDPAPFYRVSVRCGFASADEFRQAVADYRHAIRTVYSNVFTTQ